MSFLVEIAFKFLFQIVAEFVVGVVANVALRAIFLYFRSTGDFLIEVVTLDCFRDHSDVPVHRKALHPVPDWAAVSLGFCFWCGLGVAAYLSWPWLSSL